MTRLLSPEGLLIHLTARAYAQLLRTGRPPGRCLRLAVEAAERSLARIERRRRRRPAPPQAMTEADRRMIAHLQRRAAEAAIRLNPSHPEK